MRIRILRRGTEERQRREPDSDRVACGYLVGVGHRCTQKRLEQFDARPDECRQAKGGDPADSGHEGRCRMSASAVAFREKKTRPSRQERIVGPPGPPDAGLHVAIDSVEIADRQMNERLDERRVRD